MPARQIPYYCPETTETCWHILKDFLAPLVLGRDWSNIDELVRLYRLVKGNKFAQAGLEMACWDALARSQGQPLRSLLGGTRAEILSGVSLGIEKQIEPLLDQIERYQEEGYRRIKLKIAPGWDVDVVRRVRERFPTIPLQVDANSAYTLDDLPALKALDDFDLLLIEQPLAHDDIIDHARLQAALKTPICLDESIHSADDARKALDLGACRVINIKVSRVGGLREAKRVHDLCFARGVPVWCGGMHEFGIGRAANVAIASLPGFTAARRCFGLGQVLCRRHRRPADPGTRWGDPRLRRARAGRRARRGTNPGPHASRDLDQVVGRSEERGMPMIPTQHSVEHEIVDLLAELVRLESPSRDKPALDALASAPGGPLASSGRLGRDHPQRAGRRPRSRPISSQRATCARPSCWATSIPSGRAERWNGCRSASTKTAGRLAPAFST